MLHIHFANRYETLCRLLLEHLGNGRDEVFAPDQVIVPSAAVRRSLTLALADHYGICANVQFDFLAQWLWRQIGHLLPAVATESPFASAVLSWRVYETLGDTAFVAAYPRLDAYLGRADDVMRYELAKRIAGLLEQYVTYRPDWLSAWQQGHPVNFAGAGDSDSDDASWQAALWQRITTDIGVAAQHPAQLFREALAAANPDRLAASGLPSSAHVFALPTMPPLHLDLLAALGRRIDLHLYVLNPCREFWFEITSRRRLSFLRARGRDAGHEVGNHLLAAWGGQTQSHISSVLDACDDAVDDAQFVPHPDPTLLAHVHNAILDLTEIEPGSVRLADDDRSIEIHVCHSLTRELEALQDHLLGLFARADGLEPADILVVTPDLEAAAPLIDAVFGTAPKERDIPYSISGRSRSSVNAPARALLALLTLAGSRVASSAVFGLLQQAIVARRFSLDDNALQQVHDWLRASGFRWALDATHRTQFDVPANPRHTLADGLNRLFLGYALPAQVGVPLTVRRPDPFDGPLEELLPAGDAEGSDAVALGAFWNFVDALQQLHSEVSTPQSPASWSARLLVAIDTFLRPIDDEIDDVRELQEAIRGLAQLMQRGGVTQPLPLAVVHAALTQQLDDPAHGGVPTGSVTFSSMSSLRSVPFAVVCAIGLADGSFPTSTRPPEFDLMARHPQRGDRQRRIDERNLFLDLLLAARRSFYLSYTGRSVRDNSSLPPSVLVAELLEILKPAIAGDPASPDALASAQQRLVVEHPLQPFSIENFTANADARARSFNRELGEALRSSLATEPAAATPLDAFGDADEGDDEGDEDFAREPLGPFFAVPLAAPGPEWREVSLAQLVEFFRNPSRYLLRRRLGIDLRHDEDELDDVEPFLPDWNARKALARRLLPALLADLDVDAVRRLALAGTEMPAGVLGANALENELASLTSFAAQVRTATAAPCRDPHQTLIAIELDGEAWRLHAGFADLRPAGLVRCRYDEKPRAGDMLEAWLNHLFLCADPPAGVSLQTTWLAREDSFSLAPPEAPLAVLEELLRIYRRGLCAPVHFFPKSSWAYCSKGANLREARSTWSVTKYHPDGESADPAYRLALRGRGDPLDDDFITLAETVFGPLRDCMNGEA